MSTVNPVEYLLRVREAEDSFEGFCRLMHPDFDWQPYQVAMMKVLDRLERGKLRNPKTGQMVTRVMFNLPPRHAKSFFVSWLFPAYYIGRNMRRNVLAVSYSADLARDFGARVVQYVNDPRYRQVFPHMDIRKDTRAKDDWKNEVGGGYYSCGIGGSTTGKPANLLIIDDPVKNRSDAESPAHRGRVWSFYNSSLENRKEPCGSEPPIEIICLTRWHPDDLGGKIEESSDYKEGLWYHLKLPAIMEVGGEQVISTRLPEDHPRYGEQEEYTDEHGHRKVKPVLVQLPGAKRALWPSRFSLSELELKRRRNPREFDALYQQSPYVVGGGMLKEHWWRYGQPEGHLAATVIGMDTAYKKSSRNDYTVMCVMSMYDNGEMLLREVVRGRWDYPELKRRLTQLANKYRGDSLRAVYIEDKASGISLAQEMRMTSGFPIIPYKVSKDKETRVAAITPLVEGGQVYLPLGADWVDDFVNEATAFPNGTYDDQVDAFVLALDSVSKVRPSKALPDTKMSLNEMMKRADSKLRARALGT